MTYDQPIDRLVGRRGVIAASLLGSTALLLGAARPARATSRPATATSRSATATSGPDTATARGDAGPGVTLTLPAPTGPHAVGRHDLYLVDVSRPDPWDSSIPVRELMLTLYYPARPVPGATPATQLPPKVAALFGVIAPRGDVRLPAAGVDWSATLSHSLVDAPVLPGRWPVLLHSPGGGDPRGLGTMLAEDLASHGALVVSVDHPGDAAAVQFPTRTPFRSTLVRTTVLRGEPRTQPEVFRTMIDARIADLRFVLDELGGAARDALPNPLPDALPDALPNWLADALDLRRVGAYGHSAGGSAVAELLHADRRVRAAANLEGYLDWPGGPLFPIAAEGTDRPLLLLGTDGFDHRADLDVSWSAVQARSGRGRVRRGLLEDTNHGVFTDFAAMIPQLQADGLVTPAARAGLVGTLDPSVAVPQVRLAVRAFFRRHWAGVGDDA